MISIVKQTYDERVAMYAKQNTKALIGYLTARDKYKIGQVPEYLIYNNYNTLSHDFLCELISERDIYETPDACSETNII